MQQPTQTTSSLITYAALLVSALAHFGWVISSSEALAIIGGIVAVISTLWQHFSVKSANAAGIRAGTIVPNKG